MNDQQRQVLQGALSKLSPEERQIVGHAAITGQKVRKYKTYYSKIRFQFAGPTANVLTLAVGRRTAFDYGRTDAMANAGYTDGRTATDGDTNLLARGERENASLVSVRSIGLVLMQGSDPELSKLVLDNAYAEVSVDGINRHSLLGPLALIPGRGGLFGGGNSKVIEPALNTSLAPSNFISNGQPHISNMLKLEEPITWGKLGEQDSKFQIRFEVARAVTHTCPVARVAAAGIEAYDQPTAGLAGTFVDFLVALGTVEISDRSQQY